MTRRQRAVMWIAIAGLVAVGGMLSSSMQFMFTPPILAQEGQEYPFHVKTSSEVIPGATDCAFPDAFLDLATGNILYCDPDEGNYKLAGVSSSQQVIRIPGICEAFGVDAGDRCFNDDQCTDHASCSGAVCNCIETDQLTRATYGPDGNPTAVEITRFDAVTEQVVAYPGVADFGLEGTFVESRFARMGWEEGCPADGCYVFRLYGTDAVIVGDSNDPSGTTIQVYGKLALTGEGSGLTQQSGFSDGYWRINSYSADGDFFNFRDGFSTEGQTLIGSLANRSGKLSIDDGNLRAESPYIITGTRGTFVFGYDGITESGFETESVMRTAGWHDDAMNDDVGLPMPRAGHLTGIHAMCELTNNPAADGYLYVAVYEAGSPHTLLLSAQQYVSATGPLTWSATQARGIDAIAAGDTIRVEVGDGGIKTCETGSPEGTSFICTSDTECTGAGGGCGVSCDCLDFDATGGGDCIVVVEVTYDE